MEGQSIEDIILSSYIGELSSKYSVTKKTEPSPYQLPLRHTNILASHRSVRGGSSSRRQPISVRSKSSDRSHKFFASSAPVSAKKADPVSNTGNGNFVKPLENRENHTDEDSDEQLDEDAEPLKGAKGKRKKKKQVPTYLQSPEVFVVTAFRNGDRSTSSRISAPSFAKLLELCTQKLGLPSSARKLFLKSGKALKPGDHIPRGTEVYVSMGEAFKDPVKLLEKKLSLKNDLQWTLNGLNLPEDRQKECTKPVITSHRLESKGSIRRRILIFLNGKGVGGFEVIADMNDVKGVLQNCTLKFDCGQHIRKLLQWDGTKIQNLHEIKEIHPLLNSAVGTPLLGPVWASKGEMISPTGVEEYLHDVIGLIRGRKEKSAKYLEQLQLVQYADDKESVADQLTFKKILSMKDSEREKAITETEDFQEECRNFLKQHRRQLKRVEPQAKEEHEEGSQFTMKHILALPDKHRLVTRDGVGFQGMRLKVYENGSNSNYVTAYFNVMEASRGLSANKEGSKKIIFQRFLDSLSSNSLLASKNSKAKGILVQRVFTKFGNEITDLRSLQISDADKEDEKDTEIWISYGENWIDPFTYCLQAEISKAVLVTKGERRELIRTEVPLPLEAGQEKPSCWLPRQGTPEGIEHHDIPLPQKEEEQDDIQDDEEEEEEPEPEPRHKEAVPEESTFLQNSKSKELCLFAEPVVGVMKPSKEQRMLWPKAGKAQEWLIHKTGQISLKAFPRLALSVGDFEIETKVDGQRVRGFVVQFAPTEHEERNPVAQQWIFHNDGLIYSKQSPDLALTYLGGVSDEAETHPKNELENGVVGYRNMLAACPPMEKSKKHQRFGVRQTQFKNFGQWRKAEFKNPQWSKLAILWPTDREGKWIRDLEWPLEGNLLAFAPSMQSPAADSEAPKRFFCLKNGERNRDFGVFVTAPDLTNMKKDRLLKRERKSKGRRQSEDDSLDGDYLHVKHCSDWTVSAVEFKIFLETCTGLLGLSSAARRIFDRFGFEHTSLEKLDRDQELYVSTGDSWSDPNLTKSQLDARALLVKLSEDVEKIRAFVALKQTESLVLTAESLAPGSKIGVSRDLLTKKEQRARQLQEASSPPEANFNSSDGDEEEDVDPNLGLTAHQRACQRSDDKSQLRWPWEKIVSNDFDQGADESAAAETRRAASKPPAPKHLVLKQFSFEDGCICCTADTNLVLTATESNTRVMEVTLQKRRPDNLNQKWQIGKSGFVTLRYQSSCALTLQLPKVPAFGSEPAEMENAKLTVQPLKLHQFGRANQLFAFDDSRSTIRCFAANPLDVAVTAANQTGCCSYYVVPSGYRLDQPGYTSYLPTDAGDDSQRKAKFQKCTVCVSCARSLRGKYKLQKVSPSVSDFSCALGPNKSGFKETGSFAVLNGKVDLTDGEDVAALKKWQGEIEQTRQNLSVRAISSRLSEAKTPRPIRVLAYRNGEGRLCRPVPICGTSILGIMDQCSAKLQLSWAVRKLFLEDGTPVVDVDDLRRWCAANAKRVARRQREIEDGRVLPELDRIKADVADPAVADDEGAAGTPPQEEPRPDSELQSDELNPRLKARYFVIGRRFASPTVYSLGVSVFSMTLLEEILPQRALAAGDLELAVRYSIFDQVIQTDPFANEEAFDGERREIQLKSELPILRRFFRERMKLLKIDLVRLPEEAVLATSYVPLDTLIREEHEDFLTSLRISGDYAWYKKSPDQPKGARTHASVTVEISLTAAPPEEDEEAASDSDGSGTENASSANQTKDDLQEPAAPDEAEDEDELDAATDLANVCVELWASAGEAFVPLQTVHQEFKEMVRQRRSLQEVLTSKEVDKHVLKMMQGRRLQKQEPPTFRSTTDPENPVAIDGGWQTPRGDEVMVQREIQQLQEEEEKIRAKQPGSARGGAAFDFDRSLYRQASVLRVRVFQNGDDPASSATVWAETLHQILDNATVRLGLRRPAQILFGLDGSAVRDFASLSRDQILCVSSGEPFLPPRAAQQNVEIKANWGRARRMYGEKATDFQIQARAHPLVGVDPFGPPLHGRRPGGAGATAVPGFDTKRVLVFENGRHKDAAVSAWGDSLDSLLKSAAKRLGLRSPAVCFYDASGHQIVSFDEISRDDKLAASTTGKGFIRS